VLNLWTEGCLKHSEASWESGVFNGDHGHCEDRELLRPRYRTSRASARWLKGKGGSVPKLAAVAVVLACLSSCALQRMRSSRPLPILAVLTSALKRRRRASSGVVAHGRGRGLFAQRTWPLRLGDASIAPTKNALANASSRAGDATLLADVKVDHRVFTIAGIYSDFCTQAAGVALK